MANYSIKTEQEKTEMKNKVSNFVTKFGNGKESISEDQKKERMKKLVGKEIDKMIGFGDKPDAGIHFSERKIKTREELNWLLPSIDKYPVDPRGNDPSGKHIVLNATVFDDGSATIHGIVNNSKITSKAERNTYAIDIPSDKELAKIELKQFEAGKLRKVADRTKKIHIDNGDFDAMLADENLDTGDDPQGQY